MYRASTGTPAAITEATVVVRTGWRYRPAYRPRLSRRRLLVYGDIGAALLMISQIAVVARTPTTPCSAPTACWGGLVKRVRASGRHFLDEADADVLMDDRIGETIHFDSSRRRARAQDQQRDRDRSRGRPQAGPRLPGRPLRLREVPALVDQATDLSLAEARVRFGSRELVLALGGGGTKRDGRRIDVLGVDLIATGSAAFDGAAPREHVHFLPRAALSARNSPEGSPIHVRNRPSVSVSREPKEAS